MPFGLDDGERDVLAASGLVFFENRAILDAQPPIDEETLAEVEARAGAPVPEGLLALWRVSFGGLLDYRLTLEIDDRTYAIALRELFYPASGAYRDLFGWIDHEIRSAAQGPARVRRRAPKLEYLPFGGFEYLDRLYVKIAGDDAGAVFAWKEEGLPESLPLRLHDEPIARVANDVPDLFRQLAYERDPFGNAANLAPGFDLVKTLGEVAASGSVGASAAEKVFGAIGLMTLDWRPALADGTIARRPRLRDLALESAAANDDLAVLERLEHLGCELDREIAGGSTALELALAASSWRVARHLLDRNADATRTLPAVAAHAGAELIAELLIRGAEPSVEAALDAAAAARDASALLIARAYLARRRGATDELVHLATAWADDAEESASRCEAAGDANAAAGYRRRAVHLRRLAQAAPRLVSPA